MSDWTKNETTEINNLIAALYEMDYDMGFTASTISKKGLSFNETMKQINMFLEETE